MHSTANTQNKENIQLKFASAQSPNTSCSAIKASAVQREISGAKKWLVSFTYVTSSILKQRAK